jgi:hypothetical protein
MSEFAHTPPLTLALNDRKASRKRLADHDGTSYNRLQVYADAEAAYAYFCAKALVDAVRNHQCN